MKDELRFTAEDLHRYIDGEMDKEARTKLQALLERDPSLGARAAKYRSVDQSIRDAFDALEPPAPRVPIHANRTKRRRVAAALLMPAGFLAG